MQATKDEEKIRLWEAYSKTPNPKLRERLILEYAGLVKIIAGRLSMYLGHNVEYDDLVGYGVFGLIDAIDKYDYGKGVKFETYASLRIRGAILDQIRKMDWIPRTLRQKQKKLDAAYSKIENETGRAATEEELAAELSLTSEEFENWQSQTQLAGLVSLDEYLEQGSELKIEPALSANNSYGQPEDQMEKEELKKILAEAIDGLTEKEQKVIAFYYYEELTLKEISALLSVSESRVSQLHTKALQKLKGKLGEYMGIITSI